MDQDPIVNIKQLSFFNMKGTLFVVDSFENVIDMVMYYSHSIKLFLYSKRGECVVVVEVYNAWIKDMETSMWGEFISSTGCGIIDKFCKRQSCSPAVLPVIAVDAHVLLKYLDQSFSKSSCLKVVGSREVEVDFELSIQLFKEVGGELQTTIPSYMSCFSTQSSDVVNIEISNVFFYPSCFGWNIRLYYSKSVSYNQDCIAAFGFL